MVYILCNVCVLYANIVEGVVRGSHNLVNALPTLQEAHRQGQTGKSKYIRFLREQPFMFLVREFKRIFYFYKSTFFTYLQVRQAFTPK